MAEYEQLQEISSSLERGEIDGGRYLEQFTRFLAGHIGCSRATVRVFIDTPSGRALRSIAMYDATQDRMIATQDLFRADTGPYFDRLLHDGCVVVAETRTDPIVAPFRKAYLEPSDIRSVMDMCFAVNGELFGTFSCEQLTQPVEWSQRQVQMLRKLASRASLTLMHVVTGNVDTAPGALWETSTPNRLATMPMPLDPNPRKPA
jgi:GAF domain-containing protein